LEKLTEKISIIHECKQGGIFVDSTKPT